MRWKTAQERGNMSYTVFFSGLWMHLFGTTDFAGINMGFWAGMGIVGLIVIIENLVFWSMRPKNRILSEHRPEGTR